MPFKVTDFKNNWALYRYDWMEVAMLEDVLIQGTLYDLCKDSLNQNYSTDGEGNLPTLQTIGNAYSMSVQIDTASITPERIPVVFRTGTLFKNTPLKGFHRRTNDFAIMLMSGSRTPQGILCGSYGQLVQSLCSPDHYEEWKTYDDAKKTYDETGTPNYTVSGEDLLFPCERDVRKRILEDITRRRER